MSENKNHKVFISYSWTNPEYQEKVTEFVNRLRDSGIDTVYDKYDLEAGASTHVFMEKSVTDKDVDKVLILCDKEYVEKSDSRIGGAGIETLIISPKVYNDTDPAGKDKKFIPIIMERDEKGQPCIPTYLDGRIYFDFSKTDEIDHDEFESLVRYLYGKPALRAPGLGKAPSYITAEEAPYFGTTAKSKDAINALKTGKNSAFIYCDDFFEQVYDALDGLVVDYNNDYAKMEENVWDKINDLLPLRNECLEVIETMIKYKADSEIIIVIKKFLEKLLVYRKKIVSNPYNEIQANHYSFFSYEIFAYLITFLIENRQFDKISEFLNNYYYEDGDYGSGLSDFTIFYPNERIFENRNQRFFMQRVSLRADIVKDRCNYKPITFEKLMQTDLLLYICYLAIKKEKTWWFPKLLIYVKNRERAFELFKRATSKKFFNDTFYKIGIKSENLQDIINVLEDNSRQFNSEYSFIDMKKLSNINEMATQD